VITLFLLHNEVEMRDDFEIYKPGLRIGLLRRTVVSSKEKKPQYASRYFSKYESKIEFLQLLFLLNKLYKC